MDVIPRVIMDGEPRTIGEVLYLARKDAGLTQTRLSIEIGVNNSTVSNWELDRQRMTVEHWLEALTRCGYVVKVEKT